MPLKKKLARTEITIGVLSKSLRCASLSGRMFSCIYLVVPSVLFLDGRPVGRLCGVCVCGAHSESRGKVLTIEMTHCLILSPFPLDADWLERVT